MEGTGSELSSATGPLDHHVLERRHEEMREGHGSLNDGSDTLCVSELRLDEGLGSSMGSMLGVEIWRLEKCSQCELC